MNLASEFYKCIYIEEAWNKYIYNIMCIIVSFLVYLNKYVYNNI